MQSLYENQNFTWWVGVVEDRNDPQKLGRCKVRVFGYHTEDLNILPKDDLPWAIPITPITSASTSGIGSAPVGPVEGTWVIGWFLDGDEKQQPIMMGTIAGKPEKNPIVAKIITNEEANSGSVLTSSSGQPVTDGSGNSIRTGTSNSSFEFTDNDIPAVLPHPNNPTSKPAGPLNDPAFASQQGFSDPNKIYPKVDYDGLPDTNKLAAENRSHKYFNAKSKNRKTAIPKASSTATWDEPTPAYNAKYPFNQVIETEAGHVVEFDNSPNTERIHVYHKSGTYIEIDVNGTFVKKTVGDNYEVSDRNGYVYVKGAYSLTVGGPTKILVQNDADIEVNGALNLTCHGSTLVQSAKTVQVVADDIYLSGKSSLEIVSDGPVNIQGSSITLNAKSGAIAAKASKEIAISAATTASIRGGLELLLDAATVKTKMGSLAVSATKLPVYAPPESKTVSANNAAAGNLTRPDSLSSIFLGDALESDAEDLAKKRLDSGETKQIGGELNPTSTDTTQNPNKQIQKVDVSEFNSYSNFPDSLKLSKHVYLRDVSTRATATSFAVTDQLGLTKAQIVGNLKNLAVNVIDPIKDKYPDMIITSGFRVGSSGSDHNAGQAIDLQFTAHSFSDYYEIAEWIKNNVPYKQILLEYATRPAGTIAWIHVALAQDGSKAAMPIGTLANHSTQAPGRKNAFVKLI
jgi:hypothetical protein